MVLVPLEQRGYPRLHRLQVLCTDLVRIADQEIECRSRSGALAVLGFEALLRIVRDSRFAATIRDRLERIGLRIGFVGREIEVGFVAPLAIAVLLAGEKMVEVGDHRVILCIPGLGHHVLAVVRCLAAGLLQHVIEALAAGRFEARQAREVAFCELCGQFGVHCGDGR